MTREDIKRAAEQNISGYSGTDLAELLANLGRECFCYGAEWRIASVWYGKKTMPKLHEPILLSIHKGVIILEIPDKEYWEILIKDNKYLQWAYIKDLIPNTER